MLIAENLSKSHRSPARVGLHRCRWRGYPRRRSSTSLANGKLEWCRVRPYSPQPNHRVGSSSIRTGHSSRGRKRLETAPVLIPPEMRRLWWLVRTENLIIDHEQTHRVALQQNTQATTSAQRQRFVTTRSRPPSWLRCQNSAPPSRRRAFVKTSQRYSTPSNSKPSALNWPSGRPN